MNNTITTFISYSNDSIEHSEWVRQLADYLQSNGVEVILDQYELAVGKNLNLFMETSMEKADKVLIILTPGYKIKSDSRKNGVGFEYSIISTELYDIQNDNNKFLPILRTGNKNVSAPVFLKSLVYHDMTNNDRFESDAFKLLQIIHGKPSIQKPPLGTQPDFNVDKDPILEMAKSIVIKDNVARNKKQYLESPEATRKVDEDLKMTFEIIQQKAEEYKSKTSLFFRAEYNHYRLILIGKDGYCLNVFYTFPITGLKDAELIISIWDKPLRFDNSMNYPPNLGPKELVSYKFKPLIDDNMEIVWLASNYAFMIQDLKTWVFEKLLEYIQKKK